MKILVTGGAGFIGSNFIRHVVGADKRYAVVNYDKLTYAGNLANLDPVANDPNYIFVKGDICDAQALEIAMRGCDAVVHFAAESHVDRSIYEPSPVIQTNITGTFMLLEVFRKLSIQLIHREMQTRRQVDQREQPLRVLVTRREITGADRQWAEPYSPGDVVRYGKGSKTHGIQAGGNAHIKRMNERENLVTVKRKSGEELTYDPRRLLGL